MCIVRLTIRGGVFEEAWTRLADHGPRGGPIPAQPTIPGPRALAHCRAATRVLLFVGQTTLPRTDTARGPLHALACT